MFFRKKEPKPAEATFQQRVTDFWEKFSASLKELNALMADTKAPDHSERIQQFTNPLVDGLGPGFAWVYGPGDNPDSDSLTVSGEGNPHLRLLAEHWKNLAPEIEGWNFHAARQPGSIDGAAIQIGETAYTPLQFWLTPEVDEDHEVVHITAWSPAFESLPDGHRMQILFLWLDEALGEDQVSHRLGRIEISDAKLAASFPLPELPGFIAETEQRLGWQPWSVELRSQFQFKKPSLEFPRADLIAGQTTQPRLWEEYIEAEGQMANPLPDLGAGYFFLALPRSFFDPERPVDGRARLEDLLIGDLEKHRDGRLLGGGTGQSFSYIDVLFFGGAATLQRLIAIIEREGFPKEATVWQPFAGK